MTMGIAAFLLAYAGWVALAFAMDKHARRVRPGAHSKPVPRAVRLGLRLAGIICLTLALVVCGAYWGRAVGIVAWFGVLSAAGLVLVFLLPYAPRLVSAAAPLGLLAVTGWYCWLS